MVKVLPTEDIIPALLIGKILYHNNVKVFFPFGMSREYLVSNCSSADGSGHFVAVIDQNSDDMGSDKRVGSGDKCGWHCECFSGVEGVLRLRLDVTGGSVFYRWV
jgi:hypothetical protein